RARTQFAPDSVPAVGADSGGRAPAAAVAHPSAAHVISVGHNRPAGSALLPGRSPGFLYHHRRSLPSTTAPRKLIPPGPAPPRFPLSQYWERAGEPRFGRAADSGGGRPPGGVRA